MTFTASQTRSQYAAVAWLRWRIFANSFRRKGGTGELIARILVWPILAGMAFGPTILAAFASWWFAANGHLDRIAWIFWADFILCQLLNIQLGQPGTTFDPTQLIRFPLALRSYTAVRLFFGVLSPANIIGALIAFAIALGVTVAIPGLWFASLIAALVFAATNILFSRMVFTWVDRWLSTRRAREVFTAIIFTGSLGFQYLNVTYNPAYNHHKTITDPGAKLSTVATFYHRADPILHLLPPGLISSSLTAAHSGQPIAYLGYVLGCALFALFFLAIFTLRMKTEFRGESLSDVANAVPKSTKKSVAKIPITSNLAAIATAAELAPHSHFIAPASATGTTSAHTSILAGMLGKEILFLRRNTGLFYAIIAPIVFVFLFAGKLASRSSGTTWIFPLAVAYSLLGITSMAYNSLGLEAAGIQFYFLAPVRFRDILFAKNLLNFALAFLEIIVVFAVLTYSAGAPPLQTVTFTILWAGATILVSTAIGNRRSLSSPKLITLGRASRQQASGLSALISMGTFLLSAALAGALLVAATFLHYDSVLIPLFAVLFAAALWFYLVSLSSLDQFALDHREHLFEELCKKA
jgi:ABC-2 type transport system permease protein